jgi:cation transporter-like permease
MRYKLHNHCQLTRKCRFYYYSIIGQRCSLLSNIVLITTLLLLIQLSSLSLIHQKYYIVVTAFQPKLFIATISTTVGDWNSQQQQQQVLDNNNNHNSNTSNNNTNNDNIYDEAAVLRELKEIVQKQALEIVELKRNQQQIIQISGGAAAGSTSTTSSHAHHHHHGGGAADLNPSELSSYLQKPFYDLALKRVGWLSIFLASLSLTAVIMSGFEHTLSKQIELAYFVPLLAGHGGNTGGQTVGTVLSALSSGSLTKNDAPAVIAKESMSGLVVGTILGILVGPISYYIMGISMHVSVVILCTLPLVSTIAATLGAAIPFFCVWAGLDPSVIAAPAMTSIVDVCGLISYFLIAGKIFHLFGIDL